MERIGVKLKRGAKESEEVKHEADVITQTKEVL